MHPRLDSIRSFSQLRPSLPLHVRAARRMVSRARAAIRQRRPLRRAKEVREVPATGVNRQGQVLGAPGALDASWMRIVCPGNGAMPEPAMIATRTRSAVPLVCLALRLRRIVRIWDLRLFASNV
jgi:hypothetical protein